MFLIENNKKIKEKILEYVQATRCLSNNRVHFIFILSHMVFCRSFYGWGPVYYLIYNFSGKSSKSWGTYLKKDELDKLQATVNDKKHTNIVDDKILFFQRCVSNDIKTPEVLAVISRDDKHLIYPDFPHIKTASELEAFFSDKTGKFVIKTIQGSHGEGMMLISVDRGELFDFKGKKVGFDSIIKHCISNEFWYTSFFVQKYVQNRKDLKGLFPGSALGTIRIVTYLSRKSKRVIIPYAFLKIPIKGSLNDNFCHGETGNLIAGIEVESGQLMDAYGKVDGGLKKIKSHPDTNLKFSSTVIPFWPEILDTIMNCVENFNELKTLGWDIALTDKGIYILEANWHWDPDGPQVTLNRGVKKEVIALFDS